MTELVIIYEIYFFPFFFLIKSKPSFNLINTNFLGGFRGGEIPVPIPNIAVKTSIADDTIHKSMGK